jgi:SAM-dependent methyltransferase
VFAAACAAGAPGVDVRVAPAEELPFADGTFDVVLSQLVLNFLADAPGSVAGMRRVARPGGTVAACTWDYRGEMTMLRAFWQAAADVDPSAPAEGAVMRYCTPAELEELWRGAGLEAVRTDALHVERAYDGFEEVWEPFTHGVGPAGLFVRALDDDRRGALRDGFRRRLGDPSGPFTLTARAWFVAGERAG